MDEGQKIIGETADGKCCSNCGGKKKAAIGIIIALLVIGGIFYLKKQGVLPLFSGLSKSEAKTKIEKFIKENLMQPGTEFSIKEITEEAGLYKVMVSVGGQEIASYMTKDGKKFFPQAIDIDKKPDQNTDAANQNQETKTTVEAKKDIPAVDVFVMSYCPFGTQIEKGILPVLDVLKKKIKFTLKFVDYAMHPALGEVEENLRQYCIQKDDPAKFNAYLKCFLVKGGESEAKACLKTTGVNTVKVDACYKATDQQFSVIKNKDDKSTWKGQFPPFDVNKEDNVKYGVQGSPTLVINGETVSSGRDPQSMLTLICSAFTNKPKECDTKLSTDVPAAGFGEGVAAANSSTTANCNN